jgi:phage baseplate assembly protein W
MGKDIIGNGWSFPLSINSQGGIQFTNERSEINQAIQIILSTTPGQRVMRPEFGCQLQDLIFTPNNAHTAIQAQRFVEEALGMWEPRIKVIQVEVYPDTHERNRLLINIEYEIKATRDRRSLVYPFYIIPKEV